MICPIELTSDMSALRAVKVGDHAKHGFLHEGRDGAGDESTGSDFAGSSEEDHVVAGGGDHWHQRSADAALAGALRGVWSSGIIRSTAGRGFAAAGGTDGVGAGGRGPPGGPPASPP